MKGAWVCVALLVSMMGCDDEEPTRQLDGGGDGWCEAENAFVAAHRACTTDSDCVIVGSCSGGWGFRAVQRSARDEAQRMSDTTACRVFDGPLFNAACENQHCVARATGGYCGMPRPPDGGSSGTCPSGESMYHTTCDAGAPTCRRPCAGAADVSCGTDSVCEQTSVSMASGAYGTACSEDRVLTWLCR